MKGPVYLIDGYSIIYRSYFAHIKRPLKSPDGRNTSAVHGFFRFYYQIQKQIGSGMMVVALDSKTPTFRHELYQAYKANRDKTPQDLHAQIPIIEQLLAALGVPTIKQDGFEADDIIATLAEVCRKERHTCYILSGDKDMLKLVDDRVKILHPNRTAQGTAEWGPQEVFDHRGVWPSQIVDFLAITGDSSDNVPGIPGLGEKTAQKLLAQFGSLEAIYQKLQEVKQESQKQKLIKGRESAFMSHDLVSLKNNVPIKPAQLEPTAPDTGKVLEIFHKEGISSFDQELGLSEQPDSSLRRIRPGMYQAVLDIQDLDEWIAKARRAGMFAFDTETDSIDEMKAGPIGFSIATAAGQACYVPRTAAGLPDGRQCIAADVLKEKLSGLLGDSSLKLVGQNIKYDFKVLERWGVKIKNIYFDTMLAAWVLDSTRTSYGMDRLAKDYLTYETVHYTDLVKKGEDATLADKELSLVTDYAAEDADITLQLYEMFAADLKNKKLEDLFYKVEMPNLEILAGMELAGIQISPPALAVLSDEFAAKLDRIEHEIYQEAGKEFNINSTKQLREILFDDLKLKPLKFTKTGPSTDAQVLEFLAAESKLCQIILEHRSLTKLKNTYIDTLPHLVNPDTGRIHTHFRQAGTATGRLSSQDPNLQNIPVRTQEGRRIRAAFTAPKGTTLLSADYSQIELAVLAHLSEDEMLIEAFAQNKDIHNQTAALLFDTSEQEISPEMRRIGKTINFGVVYGMTAFRLARDLKISRSEAETFIKTYFEKYAGVDRFIKKVIQGAEEKGFVETICGRRRYLPRINSRNRVEKNAEDRIAVNTPIQGSAADIIKNAMIGIHNRLKECRSRLILQVHDELILEVVDEELDEVKSIVKETMEKAASLRIPLKVNIEHGSDWGQFH